MRSFLVILVAIFAVSCSKGEVRSNEQKADSAVSGAAEDLKTAAQKTGAELKTAADKAKPDIDRLGAKAQDALKLVGLEGFGIRHPHELSGGMKQRVSIARGLVQDPPVLLMDEPFAALDEQTRMTMGDELLRIWAATGKTVIFVTHSLTEAVYLADEVVVMSPRPGRIVDRLEVALPRPRTFEMLSGDTFGSLRDRIWRHIRKSA